MEEIVTTLLPVFLPLLPFFLIGAGAVLLIIGSWENLRWRFNLTTRQHLLINLSGGLLLLVGVSVILLPVLLDARQAQPQEEVTTPTPLPATFVAIAQPEGTVVCSPAAVVCSFEISGMAGGVAPPMDQYRLATFVFPLEHLGAGFFIQPRLLVIQDDGSWAYPSATIGTPDTPAEAGQQLRVRAALVTNTATIDGTRLDELPPGFYLGRVEDIDGIIALSAPVDLVVEN